MVQTIFALILFLGMVAHKANSVKGFFEIIKDMVQICGCSRYFSHRILRLKICSVVLLLALNPARIWLAWGFKPAQDEFHYSTDEANNKSTASGAKYARSSVIFPHRMAFVRGRLMQ